MKQNLRFALSTLIVVSLLISCARYLPHYRSHYYDVNSFVHQKGNSDLQPFLKVHLKNGHVGILNHPWIIDSVNTTIKGNGFLYDVNRSMIADKDISIAFSEIVILETNGDLGTIRNSKSAGLVILGLFNAAITISCIINPKACFGSCPTFYTSAETDIQHSIGEGFSNAISPSLEYGDIDALNNGPVLSDRYTLFMKNEALETHCIDDLRLHIYPRKSGNRVLHTPDDHYFMSDKTYPVLCALHGGNDITPLLKESDLNEWYSLADSNHLSSKEEILLNFNTMNQIDDAGLQIGFRQTLMTTYFIYSAMGYMGDLISDFFAQIETSPEIQKSIHSGIKAELGNIDVYMRNTDEDKWEYQGSYYETGPIAVNHQVLPLKQPLRPGTQIKLRLNKGLWRIDYVKLVNLTTQVEPIEILPDEILCDDVADPVALQSLHVPGQYVTSMPGSTYKITFKLPDSQQDYEIFLYSKGYYLEWMRDEWLKEKDLMKLRQMLKSPKAYLRDETASYKEYEYTMEETFWNSRITKPIAYEN